ncbi:MAG: YgdI/YgdR family lipoprotein [Verrucomicrobiota bacterium]
MKKTFALLLIAMALTGCRSRYDVTLSNGTRFTGVSKPRIDKKTGQYRFKMPDGRVGNFNAGNVRLIEPHRDDYEFRTSAPSK